MFSIKIRYDFMEINGHKGATILYDHKNVSCTVAAILTKVVKTTGSLGDITLSEYSN